MRLVRLSPEIESAVREVAAEYGQAGMARFEEILADYPGAVRAHEEFERRALGRSRVPFSFFLGQLGDGRIAGTIRLRHELVEDLWQDGGHIGYDVRPSMRKRGYATRMLALVLDEARRIGLDWVLLTVDPENAPSIRVIEKNGGTRIGVGDRSGYLQYRIESCEPPWS